MGRNRWAAEQVGEMMKMLSRLLLLAGAAVLMVGCKIAIIVPEGGSVQSENLWACVAGNVCIVRVNDTDFANTFYAVADPGWYFHRWSSGEGFLCADSAKRDCELSFSGLEKTDALEAFVASSETFYLMPVFKEYPRAIRLEDKARTIVVDGEEWHWMLPTEELSGYSYEQVREVCPAGVCSGALPGSSIDLTGYTWASANDAALLILAYQSLESILYAFGGGGSDAGDAPMYAMLRDPPGRTTSRSSGQLETCFYVMTVWDDFGGIDCGSERGIPWFWRPVD